MTSPSSSLAQQMQRLERRKWWALGAFLAVLAVGWSLVLFLPDVYESEATVLVEGQQVPEAFIASTVTNPLNIRLQTISQEIMSRSRLQSLIETYNLYPDLRSRVPLESVVERMREDIELELKGVDRQRSGDATIAFTIAYRGSDPQKVARVANHLASEYIEENLKNRVEVTGETAEFLKVQLDKTRAELDALEQRVSAFKEQHIGELPQQLESNLATLERLNQQLSLNSEKQIRARQQAAVLSQQLAGLGEMGTGGEEAVAAPSELERELATLRSELADLRSRYTEKYPDVVRAKNKIRRLERAIASGEGAAVAGSGAGRSPEAQSLRLSLGSVQAEIRGLEQEERNLRARLSQYETRVENVPKREQEFQQLARNYQQTKEHYASLLSRYNEAVLARSLEERQKGEKFRILDPATIPQEPAAPNRKVLLLAALFLAAGAAVGAVLLTEQLDTSFHTVDELRSFSRVPVLVSIAPIVTGQDRRRARRRTWMGAVAGVAGLILLVASSYWIAHGNERLVGFLL